MRRTLPLLPILLIVLCTGPALAGDVHPALRAELDAAPADAQHKVIVHMAEQAPVGELDAQLKRRRASLRDRHREVVEALQLAARSQTALTDLLAARRDEGSVAGWTGHWISNLVVLKATRAVIEEVAARADVRRVAPAFAVEPIAPVGSARPVLGERSIGVTPGLEAIRAPEVWYELGFTGQGALVGSLDTGVDGAHPALTERWRGNHASWEECWLDVVDGDTSYPLDTNGHGTHTCGTMAGVAQDDTVGVAWQAEWIACNAIDMGVGEEFDLAVIAAFEWFADPDGDPGTVDDVPDVVQNSWGVAEHLGYPDCFDLWWAVIDNCEAAGVTTIWSAGNEGPDPGTLRSPPDRATTLTNSLSVGAVDATNHDWPYPIADFSSRGPTGCDVPSDHEIKPETVAPGVQVYSSIPGGGYGENSGTSMAGPHVSGVVALMRSADPNLDVDTIKTIIMETSVDLGDPGEDNAFGHGHLDAYAAVAAVIEGFGELSGTVTNASWGGAPLPGAAVELVGNGYRFLSASDGTYAGLAAPALYTARASLAGFAPQEFDVLIAEDGFTVQDFSLTDVAGPAITGVSEPVSTPGGGDPIVIGATVVDYSTVADVQLHYSLNGGAWVSAPMGFVRSGEYAAELPALPPNTSVDYYVWAEDGLGLTASSPAGAPAEFYTLYVTELVYAWDAEGPFDGGWRLGIFGDDATAGQWVWVDPVATEHGGTPVQPEDDHTPDPGVMCFVTGNGPPGDGAHSWDVDGGCTTLLSPIMDLTGSELAFLTYWRWYCTFGLTADDDFVVDVSADGGSTWTDIERFGLNENSWQRAFVELSALIPLTDQVVVRFVACDQGLPSLVDAAIDDFMLEGYTATTTAVPGWGAEQAAGRSLLLPSLPNPFHPAGGAVRIGFGLAGEGPANLKVYDLSGRLVRTLAEGRHAGGAHEAIWDGRDDRGRAASSGVYFYRLDAGGEVSSRRLVLIR